MVLSAEYKFSISGPMPNEVYSNLEKDGCFLIESPDFNLIKWAVTVKTFPKYVFYFLFTGFFQHSQHYTLNSV